MQIAMKIIGLPALSDNYIWILHSTSDKRVWVVDPGEASEVIRYINKHDLTLAGILVTHHHYDHVDGIPELLNTYEDVTVYGNPKGPYPYITHPLKEGDEITLESFVFKVYATPGHTHDHLTFYHPEALFCGDTVFTAGCGKSWHTSYKQFANSLMKIRHLVRSNHCKLYCAHEYSWANINFASMVEPNNPRIEKRKQKIKSLRRQGVSCVPSLFFDEKLTNPFLRFDYIEIKQALEKINAPLKDNKPETLFMALRNWKDQMDATGKLEEGLD